MVVVIIRNFDSAAAVIAGAKRRTTSQCQNTTRNDRLDEWRDWLTLFQQDIPLLTIHLRTKEMSRVPAHYEMIDDIVGCGMRLPDTLLQLNGDIENYTDGVALAQAHPGVDGIMIGRGFSLAPCV